MTTLRSLPAFLIALLGACSHHDAAAPTTPAVPMPTLDAAIANSTPGDATRGMSDKTWLWTLGGGPAQIHYSAADGQDFVWLVGERRIFSGEWRVAADPNARGRMITSICLRYPGVSAPGLSEAWKCEPAGKLFYQMTERESGDPLRIAGRTQAQVMLESTPSSLAEVQARVR